MVKLKIKVTKDILDRSAYCGLTEDQSAVTQNCAIALATREIFPHAEVGEVNIDVYDGPVSSVWTVGVGKIDLPQEATDFIHEFDKMTPIKRREMPELEFEVNVPDSVINMISLDEIKSLLKNSSTMELVEQ